MTWYYFVDMDMKFQDKLFTKTVPDYAKGDFQQGNGIEHAFSYAFDTKSVRF